MNERIKELLIQSEVFNKDGTVLKDVCGYELNKFAELIVRECAGIVNENDFEGSSLGDRLFFEHFGLDK